MTAQYTGIKGTRSLQEFQPNTYAPGGEPPCATCLPGYTYLASNGNTTKNSGKVQLHRRFHGGVSTDFTYVYSKAEDDSGSLISYGGATGGGGGLPLGAIAQNWMNLAGERGPSVGDQRHSLSVQMQYSTGVGVHGGALLSGWRGLIIKGWTFLTNINLGSGMPFTPIYINHLSRRKAALCPTSAAGVYRWQRVWRTGGTLPQSSGVCGAARGPVRRCGTGFALSVPTNSP